MPRAKPTIPLDDSRRALVEENLGIAKTVANEYARQVVSQADRDDIFGAAMLGLCSAAASYDPSRGHEFHDYAFKCCHKKSLDELLDSGLIRSPKYLRAKAGKDHPYREAHDRLRTMAWSRGVNLAAIVDHRPDPADQPETPTWQEIETAIHSAISGLPDRQRRVIERTLEGRSRDEIAAELGISGEGVRKIRRRVAVRLKDAGFIE